MRKNVVNSACQSNFHKEIRLGVAGFIANLRIYGKDGP
jgi:hypothetical protein